MIKTDNMQIENVKNQNIPPESTLRQHCDKLDIANIKTNGQRLLQPEIEVNTW